MSDEGAVRLGGRRLYDGRVLALDLDRVRLPHGREVDLEIVRHPGSVVLLPMTGGDRLILVRQYRYAPDRWIWELPAGSLEPGEDPQAAAARECHEETGLTPGRIERLGALYPTPGFCDEQMIFFRLTDLRVPDVHAGLDEDELLQPRTFGLDELRRLLSAGDIVDMKTVAGLSLIGVAAGR